MTCREKTAGFTGDTSFCPGMEEIVRTSDLAFVEASYPVHQSVHMGIDKILELQKKYPENVLTFVSSAKIRVYNSKKQEPKK